MSNFIEDSINFGMGLFAYSREKIEEIVEKMVEKGEVQRKDAQSFAADLIRKGEQQREDLHKMVKEEVQSVLNADKSDCCITKEELREIIREELAQAHKQDESEK